MCASSDLFVLLFFCCYFYCRVQLDVLPGDVIDDPTLKPQVDHFLCKRAHETDTVSGYHAECGPMPDFTDAHPPKDPPKGKP